ncbi:hypothetical protein RF11_06851 [Thelohanellus kitauei]|uniref:Uncharacterized protein n=1 Tax=Thelohanellus kitauei TaxID=669202 RepID=A0A0C2JZ92_THEKT|nr:hypothetical protein RF11_06851 [Thelohanellus kitauei]
MPLFEAPEEVNKFKFTLLDDIHCARRACLGQQVDDEDILTEAHDAELFDIWESNTIENSSFLEANELLAIIESFTLKEIAERSCAGMGMDSEDQDIIFEEEKDETQINTILLLARKYEACYPSKENTPPTIFDLCTDK